MALKIRLRQQGRKNRQTYRLVVMDSRTQRSGKYLEMLGWYNPFQSKDNIFMNEERIRHWIGVGAQISESVESLMANAAPSVLKDLKAQRLSKRAKLAAQRKGKKGAAAPAPAKKAAAEKPVAEKKVAKKPAAKKAKTTA